MPLPLVAILCSSLGQDPAAEQYEADVLARVRAQPVGSATVAHLGIPEAVLRQVADDEIQSAFFRKYQVVSVDVPRRPSDAPEPVETEGGLSWIDVRVHAWDTRLAEFANGLAPDRPASRGFRGPAADGSTWPPLAPGAAADIVARDLATEGLLPTLARVIETLGPERFVEPGPAERELLRAVGLPVDLLGHYRTSGDAIAWLARLVRSGTSSERLARALRAVTFEYAASDDAFVVADESGGATLELLRLQLPRGTHWRAPGAGDSVDIVRQLVERLPDVPLLISLQNEQVRPFLGTAAAWASPPRGQVTVIAEPFPVSRWAQDNGKSGYRTHGIDVRPASLLPRFASRRHDGSELVVGDTMIAGGLTAAGHGVVRSPLLFQGGNLIGVVEPGGRRTLLAGEAEIGRNLGLGLGRDQVTAMFATEMGVDRCVVLPAVSYHIDFEVSVRVVGDEVIAFVGDTDAAQRIILETGVDALERGGALTAGQAAASRRHLRADDPRAFLSIVGPSVYGRMDDGAYPLSFARVLELDAGDSGVGNLQRLLVAMDMLVARTDRASASRDPLARAYLRSIVRDEERRARLRRVLEGLGWRVVPVPSLVMGDRSICTLNGIHDRTRYLMPAYGGLFSTVDQAAMDVIRETVGPDVEIIPIRCGETQRRIGGVHCVASAFAR